MWSHERRRVTPWIRNLCGAALTLTGSWLTWPGTAGAQLAADGAAEANVTNDVSRCPGGLECDSTAATSSDHALVSPSQSLPPPPPGPEAEYGPSRTSGPAVSPAAATEPLCRPNCRSGFTCIGGQCVSLCNPGCGVGEVCTSYGACEPSRAAAAAVAPLTPAPPPRTNARRHDGFYLRLGIGVGWFASEAEPQTTSSVEEIPASTAPRIFATGLAIPTELAIGGTPGAGVALGVGFYSAQLPLGTYFRGRGDFVVRESAEAGALSMTGVFINHYVVPTAGFNYLVSPCVAVLVPGESETVVDETLVGVGYGAVFGLGYEGWIANQWSMGVSLRIQYATGTLWDDDGDKAADFSLLVPGVLLTTTLH